MSAVPALKLRPRNSAAVRKYLRQGYSEESTLMEAVRCGSPESTSGSLWLLGIDPLGNRDPLPPAVWLMVFDKPV